MRIRLCHARHLVLLLGLATACGRERSGQTPVQPPMAKLPALREVPLQLQDDQWPWQDRSTMSVTLGGQLTFQQGEHGSGRYVTVDSTGAVLAQWGRGGEGPGESWSEALVSADSEVVLIAFSPPAVLVYTVTGELVSDLRGQPVEGFPQALVGDSVDRSFGQRLVGSTRILEDLRGPIVRSCIKSDCQRELLPADDSILIEVHLATPRRGGLRWPPYAATAGRFVLGDGVGYRLWMFNDQGKVLYQFGRTIPPRTLTESELDKDRQNWVKRLAEGAPVDTSALKQRLLTEPLPHFGYYGIGFDGQRRLWVSGWAHDSTFLDVFADSVFLGRLMLDCRRERGGMAIRGAWLALMCTDDDNPERPYQPHLYRIVDG